MINNNNYNKLKEILSELFEIDKADLDFGIYRIMNQKRDVVMDFIDNKLPKEIRNILSKTLSVDKVQKEAELNELGKTLDTAGIMRETAPKYVELKQQIEQATDTNALEQEIFSLLTNFFKRYYKDGDFISQRRYKKDVYAIPYEGEEVKLHWANADQYYIKTSEYLKNYAFILRDGKKVHFQLKEANTEQNNNKAQGDEERRFALYTEQPYEEVGNELYINFTYEPHKKSVKQSDLMQEALDYFNQNPLLNFYALYDKASTDKNKERTVLEKHLNDFISRNTFDYFIHKDLGGFLNRELDFFIKNEVLYIDDIDMEHPDFFVAQLSKIKAMKSVAQKIIQFLAQIEDFQKKLWLKKKFVIRTDYCITLDKIPTEYYPEIFKNKEQLAEWKTLFDVEIQNVEQLNFEPYLVLDTKFFSEAFKDQLLGEFDNLDEETNGVLINSENFQALNLMKEKYRERVDTVYIDPPYNAKSSEIVYKNTFKHSSFMSFIHGRLAQSKQLLKESTLINVAIDDYEGVNVKNALDLVFGSENFISNIVVIHNPRGRNDDKFYGTAHEYMYVYGLNKELCAISNFLPTEEDLKQYNRTDDISKYTVTGYMRTGNNSNKFERPNLFYPIYINPVTKSLSLVKSNEDSIEILPINDAGEEKTWRWGKDTFEKQKDTEILVTENNGKWNLQKKRRFFGQGKKPKTIWHDSRYDASTNGIMLMKAIFDSVSVFSYPKSVFTVFDTLSISSKSNSLILDYFAGSGTTGHATIKLNREDGGNRKYILVEMGTYFDTVTKPRIQKVIYSDNWKNGKPQDKDGISQMFKYQVLESYEDTLNNLALKDKDISLFSEHAQEEYLLKYMLDMESRDHLFDIEIFKNPFNYQLKVTENNELIPTKVDLVETFNYLIGLYVERIQRVKDDKRDIKFVEGTTREGQKTLIVWRNMEVTTNEETQIAFRKLYESPYTNEFDQIYVNGDNNFRNFRVAEDVFKVKLVEAEFFKRMFEETV